MNQIIPVDRKLVQNEVRVSLLKSINIDQCHYIYRIRAVGIFFYSLYVLIDAHCWGNIAMKRGFFKVLVDGGIAEQLFKSEGHGSNDQFSV